MTGGRERPPDSLPLVAQLSAALVAFTIETDDEAEQRLPHRTTSFGGGGGPPGSVWMTSLAMWFNCLRGLDAAGGPLTVAELEREARMPTKLDGMRRWGYVTIDGTGRVKRAAPRPAAKPSSVLVLTRRGAAAAALWRPLPGEIESRWRSRFGSAAVDRLRGALLPIAAAYGRALPDFLPIGSANGVGLSNDDLDRSAALAGADADPAGLPLITLLARVLLAFALDYEDGAKLSLGAQLDCVRVLDPSGRDGVALRELPALTGVSKAAVDVLVGRLARVGCVVLEPLPGGARGKQLRLTADRGVRAAIAGPARLARTLDDWRSRFGADLVAELGAALEPIVGDGTRAGSPLFAGLGRHELGWRAKAPRPERLPWFPMVLHRGGYPDGS